MSPAIFIISVIFLVENIKQSSTQTDSEFWGSIREKTSALTQPGVYYSKKHPDKICCQCTSFFICKDGVINTGGVGTIDTRVGNSPPSLSHSKVNLCPTLGETCCRPPDADPSCLDELITSPDIHSPTASSVDVFTPDPSSNCECLAYKLCSPEHVVSNGLGETSIELSNGRLVNHSQCRHALEVCCFLPDLSFLEDPIDPTPLPTELPQNTEQCTCVEKSLCGPDGHILTTGVGIIEVRLGNSNVPKPCPFDPTQVCCLPKKTNPLIPTTNLPINDIIPPISDVVCGQRNVNGIGVRIHGFTEGQAQFGEYPWVVALVRKEVLLGKEYLLFVGGGSLINRRVVLTAAHKVAGLQPKDLFVRLGEWDSASDKEYLPVQEVAIDEIIVHEDFNSGSIANGVALLILKKEAKINYHISPICLAKDLNNINLASCVINGWGQDTYRTGQYQHIMKSVQLPLVEHNTCQSLLRNTRLSKFFELHPSFICAGGEQGIDACLGDGGGPLSCPLIDNPYQYVQVGITAWGIGCGEKDVPGVYVNIPFLYHWIEKNMESRLPGSKLALSTLAKKSSVRSKREEPLGQNWNKRIKKNRTKEERKLERAEKKAMRKKLREEGKLNKAERKELRLKNREERKKKRAERKEKKLKKKAERKRKNGGRKASKKERRNKEMIE